MIQIILSNKAFENDVYPLVKAFYPQETIKVSEWNEMTSSLEEENKPVADSCFSRIRIDFEETGFRQ